MNKVSNDLIKSLMQFSEKVERTKTMTIKEVNTFSVKGKFVEYKLTRISLN